MQIGIHNSLTCVCVLTHVWLCVTPWTVTHHAPLSMGFSRLVYWSGLPFSALGDLPDPGIKSASLMSLALAGGFFTTSAIWEVNWSLWIIEKAREFQKNIYFCFIDYAKAFGCVDHKKLLKILKVMGIPDHLTSLLRNLYAGKEATVGTGHGTTDWFQIGKGVRQILSPCFFIIYAEYIMQNARLDEAQAGIKIVRRNINNLRYADDTTLMAES